MKVFCFLLIVLLAYIAFVSALPSQNSDDEKDGIVEGTDQIREKRDSRIEKIEREGDVVNELINIGIDDIETSFVRNKRDINLRMARKPSKLVKRENEVVASAKMYFMELAIKLAKYFSDILSGVTRKSVDELKKSVRSGNLKKGFKIFKDIGKSVIKNRIAISQRKNSENSPRSEIPESKIENEKKGNKMRENKTRVPKTKLPKN